MIQTHWLVSSMSHLSDNWADIFLIPLWLLLFLLSCKNQWLLSYSCKSFQCLESKFLGLREIYFIQLSIQMLSFSYVCFILSENTIFDEVMERGYLVI